MIELLLILAVIAFVTWVIITVFPMPPVMRQMIIAIAVVGMLLYLLRALGIGDIPVPRVR